MSRFMRMLDDNIRVLPVLIIAAIAMFGFKSADLWTSIQEELVGIRPAQAEASSSSASGGHDTTAYEPEHESSDPLAPTEEEGEAYGYAVSSYDDTAVGISRSEVEVLENLSQRRAALDARENDIVMRERLLEAAERRVDERIAELSAIQARIEGLLLQRDEEEEAQLQSLVTVYENMRPKDAAAIFERLDQQILVDVASRMREARIAPILAEMQPESAQELTVLLATRLAQVDEMTN